MDTVKMELEESSTKFLLMFFLAARESATNTDNPSAKKNGKPAEKAIIQKAVLETNETKG